MTEDLSKNCAQIVVEIWWFKSCRFIVILSRSATIEQHLFLTVFNTRLEFTDRDVSLNGSPTKQLQFYYRATPNFSHFHRELAFRAFSGETWRKWIENSRLVDDDAALPGLFQIYVIIQLWYFSFCWLSIINYYRLLKTIQNN